jgi:hypothetical protein
MASQPPSNLDRLHDNKVVDKTSLTDPDKERIGNLTEEDVTRLIEIANKLYPGRSSPVEISLLF